MNQKISSPPNTRFILLTFAGSLLLVSHHALAQASAELEIYRLPALLIKGPTNVGQAVLYSSSPEDRDSWQLLSRVVPSTSGVWVVDFSATTNGPKRFYKTVAEPSVPATATSPTPAGRFYLADPADEAKRGGNEILQVVTFPQKSMTDLEREGEVRPLLQARYDAAVSAYKTEKSRLENGKSTVDFTLRLAKLMANAECDLAESPEELIHALEKHVEVTKEFELNAWSRIRLGTLAPSNEKALTERWRLSAELDLRRAKRFYRKLMIMPPGGH